MSDHLIIGQRVQTPLGLATILGFERFGKGLPGHRGYVPGDIVNYDNGGRVSCLLDDPGRWSLSKGGHFPCITRREIDTGPEG